MHTLGIYEMLSIRLAAARIANEENPNYRGALGDIIHDGHYRLAIRQIYGTEENWKDEMTGEVMQMFRGTEMLEKQAETLSGEVLGDLLKAAETRH